MASLVKDTRVCVTLLFANSTDTLYRCFGFYNLGTCITQGVIFPTLRYFQERISILVEMSSSHPVRKLVKNTRRLRVVGGGREKRECYLKVCIKQCDCMVAACKLLHENSY